MTIPRKSVGVLFFNKSQFLRREMNRMNIFILERKLHRSKRKLERLFERKGYTDREVLRVGDEVDRLLNLYARMQREMGSFR